MRIMLFLIALILLIILPIRAQEQYFTDESNERLPDTTVWSGGVEVGDIDGDGDMDICVATMWGWDGIGPCYLLVNNGSGYFSCESDFRLPPLSTESSSCSFGDIDWDDDLDLYVCNKGTGSNCIDFLFINNGFGIFQDQSDERLPYFQNETISSDFASFLGNFRLDILAQGFWQYSVGTRLFMNDGFGFFTDVTSSQLPDDLYDNMYICVGDIDNDLDLDFIESCYDNEFPYFWGRLLKNIGNGYFTDDCQEQIPLQRLRHIAMGNIDFDRDLDVITTIGGHVNIWINDGSGYFIDETLMRFPEDSDFSGVGHLALGDFDNDGDLDIYMGSSHLNSDQFFLNNGHGYFSNANDRLPPNARSVYWVELLDVELDGDLDVYGACSGTGRQQLMINHSTPDSIPPNVLTNTIFEGLIDSLENFPVYVSAWDNISVAKGELKGILHYRINEGNIISLPMLPLGGTLFGEKIPGQPIGTNVCYYIELIDRMENRTYQPVNAPDSVYCFIVSDPTKIEDPNNLSKTCESLIGFPNPFNSSIILKVNIAKGGDFNLVIYDLSGRLVSIIKQGGFLSAGEYEYKWNATDNTGKIVSSGIYYARIFTRSGQKTCRLIFLK